MKRFALTAVAGVFYCTGLLAAPVDQHIRGKIVSVTPDTLVVGTSSGANVSLALNAETHYLQVVRSSLDKIEPGSYIGTATKDVGSTLVALEVPGLIGLILARLCVRGADRGELGGSKGEDRSANKAPAIMVDFFGHSSSP